MAFSAHRALSLNLNCPAVPPGTVQVSENDYEYKAGLEEAGHQSQSDIDNLTIQ